MGSCQWRHTGSSALHGPVTKASQRRLASHAAQHDAMVAFGMGGTTMPLLTASWPGLTFGVHGESESVSRELGWLNSKLWESAFASTPRHAASASASKPAVRGWMAMVGRSTVANCDNISEARRELVLATLCAIGGKELLANCDNISKCNKFRS